MAGRAGPFCFPVVVPKDRKERIPNLDAPGNTLGDVLSLPIVDRVDGDDFANPRAIMATATDALSASPVSAVRCPGRRPARTESLAETLVALGGLVCSFGGRDVLRSATYVSLVAASGVTRCALS